MSGANKKTAKGRFAGKHEVKSGKKKIKAKQKAGPIDLTYLLITGVLLIMGLIMLYSSSYPFAYSKYGDTHKLIRDQLVFFAVGLVVMLFISAIDFHIWQQYAYVILGVAFILLVVVLFMEPLNNARRWIWLPIGGTLQPSEIAKLAVILMFAHLLTVHENKVKTIKYGILPFFIILLGISGLLILEPHLSCTLLVLGIGFSMMFVGGSNINFLVLTVVLGLGSLLLAIIMFPDQIPYISPRLTVWKDPFNKEYQTAYQVLQSLITVGSGGMFGNGIGKSAQKFSFLPEMHNDYIFAIWCEELGFVGATILVIAFVLLFVRGIFIAIRTQDRFGKLIVVGISVQIALQAFLHMSVNINLIPSTGISLPFFSSGGTSLVMLMAQIGMVLSVSRHADLTGERIGKEEVPEEQPAEEQIL